MNARRRPRSSQAVRVRRARRAPPLSARDYGRRLLAVAALLGLSALALSMRLVHLQVLDTERGHAFLQQAGAQHALRVERIESPRGSIFDRNGQPLAISVPTASVWADARRLAQHADRWPALADGLGEDVEALSRRLRSNAGRPFFYLSQRLPAQRARAVLDLRLPGIGASWEPGRFYPVAERAAHWVGVTNRRDAGQEGIERLYDAWLRGQPGQRQVVISGKAGVASAQFSRRVLGETAPAAPARAGKDLYLSIDARSQSIAHRELKRAVAGSGATAGALVVVDVRSGEIIAGGSYPDFNPNDFAQRRPASGRMRNRVALHLFEPGSTVKPFVIAAGMQHGVLGADAVIDTAPGHMDIHGKHLADTVNHGQLSPAEVLAKSSQVGAVRIGLQMPPERLLATLDAIGFGRPSGSAFPGESLGFVPASVAPGSLRQAALCYGYGLSVNVMQLARAYMVLANSGRLAPLSLLRRDAHDDDARELAQALSPSVARAVLRMLETVVAPGGTGARARIPGYRVAGKTGTVHKTRSGGYREDRYVALFAGIVPASAPRYVAVVMLDEPSGQRYHGGSVAAPLFARVMGEVLRLMRVPPDAADGESA